MKTTRRYPRHLALMVPLLLVAGCVSRPLEKPDEPPRGEVPLRIPLNTEKEVDLLFVIDNSGSMEDEQAKLARQFPKLIDALRTPKLGPIKPGAVCNESNTSGCKIPNVRIGVVSSDLGAGNYNLGGCTASDQGKLQRKQRVAGCQPPTDRWISYTEGVTNVPGAGKDPVEKVKEAFSCVAQLGISGCGYEQPMEAALQALDPTLNRNPGFLRNDGKSGRDALLAVVFITDEDDCSARLPNIFDPNNRDFAKYSEAGFRCFLDGVSCAGCSGPDCGAPGKRAQCKAVRGKYLHGVDRYISFFRKLKEARYAGSGYERVIMAAVAGPTHQVEVVNGGGAQDLGRECQMGGGPNSGAAPAIRIQSLVHAFARKLSETEVNTIKAKKSDTRYWIDAKGAFREENFTSICGNDFAPALKQLGQRIVAALVPPCLRAPALTSAEGIICRKGDVLFQDPTSGSKTICKQSCLNKADFVVKMGSSDDLQMVPRCPDKLFNPSIAKDKCGDHCGCWRVVPNVVCRAESGSGVGSSPYAVEVMLEQDPPKNTVLEVRYLASPDPWGSKSFAELPQCI